ncbi:type IV pilin [Halorubrum xinjiangense]|nr:type IV pilin [Halorubrum xinjiangense]
MRYNVSCIQDLTELVDENLRQFRRAVSPVIGVVLMVVIVVVLAGTVAGFVLSFDDRLEEPDLDVDENTPDSAGNPWGEDELLAPEDATAGAEGVRYRLLFEVKSEDSVSEDSEELSNIDVVVTDGGDMFTNVAAGDFERLEINGEEQDVSESEITWDSDSGGAELNIEMDGVVYDPTEGDEVTLIFSGVDNPDDPGNYDVDVELNGDDRKEGDLEIVDDVKSILARQRPTLSFTR